jgi:hypothetical protein
VELPAATEKVFYAWQSDLPPAANRNFILSALEAAAESLRRDKSLEVEPVVDRDTQGVPGSPDISATILEKIDQAAVFVGDVSIINQASSKTDRPTPNPNVLLELGYAVKALGLGRIILVINTAFGSPEQLPFDLRMKRVLPYNMPENSERAPERKALQRAFESALRAILEGKANEAAGTLIQPPPLGNQAALAVGEGKPNRIALTKRYMRSVADELNQLSPDLEKADRETLDEPLVDAIDKTEQMVITFAELCDSVALMNDEESAREIYLGFGPILEGYNLPLDFSGSSLLVQFDFHKFMGQELFLVLVGKLVIHDRWELLASLLNEDIYVANADRASGRGDTVSFGFISAPVNLLEHRNQRLNLRRVTLMGDILNKRHGSGPIANASSMDEITAADLFLFLRSTFSATEGSWYTWVPHSAVYLRGAPAYLVKAKSSKYAMRLLPALAIDSIGTFRTKLAHAHGVLSQMFRGNIRLFFPGSPSEIGSDTKRR